jgi:hypothetical protein
MMILMQESPVMINHNYPFAFFRYEQMTIISSPGNGLNAPIYPNEDIDPQMRQ